MRKMSLCLLLAFVFSVPWQNAVVIGGSRTLSSAIGAAALVATLITCITENRIVKPPAYLLALFAFVVWQFATYLWSIDSPSTLSRLLTLAQILVFVWLVTELCTGEHEKALLLQAFVIGCVVVCLLLIQAYLSGQYLDANRYAPSSFNTNESADIIAVGVVMAFLANTYRERGAVFWLNIAFVPLALFSVLLTASRSGFIVTCIAMSAFPVVLRSAKPAYRLMWLLAVLVVFAGLFFGLSGNEKLQANIQRVTFSTDTYSLRTLTGRTTIWTAGLNVFAEHPLVGTGSGTFASAAQDELGASKVAHDLFIEVGADSGSVGLALLLAVLASALVTLLTRNDGRIGLYLVLFLALLTTSLVANVATSKAFWFGLALLSVGTGVTSHSRVSGYDSHSTPIKSI